MRSRRSLRVLASDRFFLTLVEAAIVIAFLIMVATGCSTMSFTPRSTMSEVTTQPPRALIDLDCGGHRGITAGVATCELKQATKPEAWVKILPVPGRVVFSDGLTKVPIDFNYRKDNGWIWQNTIIDRTWVPLDMGRLSTIFGDVPIAFDVQGQTSDGIVTNRGLIFTRVCDDKVTPCSRLTFDFDCARETQTVTPGVIGSCIRISGSSQKIRVPVAANGLKVGSRVVIHSPADGWSAKIDVSDKDVSDGSVLITYPSVQSGPDLMSLITFTKSDKGTVETHGNLLLIGYPAQWTGVDRPHLVSNADGTLDACIPFRANLLEISEGLKVQTLTSDCVRWGKPKGQVCAFAYDRESGDQTYACVKDQKDVRFPK